MADRMMIALPETIRDGVECEVLDDGTGAIAAVEVAGHGTVTLPREWLKPVLSRQPSLGTAFRFADTLIEHRDVSGIGWYDWQQKAWLTWPQAVERGVLGGQRLIPEPDMEWLTDQLQHMWGWNLQSDTDRRSFAASLLDAIRGRT